MKIFKAILFLIIFTIAAGVAGKPACCADDAAIKAGVDDPKTGKSYNLNLSYNNGQLSAKGTTVENFRAPDYRVQPQDGWICDIVSSDGQPIYSFRFSIPVITCRDQPGAAGDLEGGCQEVAEKDFILSVPYYSNGAKIVVYSPEGNEVFSIDTVKFADLCGDNVCEAGENRLTCAEDCRSGVKDGVCDGVADGTCDADCSEKTDNDCSRGSQGVLIYSLIAAVLGLVVLTIFIIRQLNNRRENSDSV